MTLLDIATRAEWAEDPDREMFIAAWTDVFAPGGSMNIRDWPDHLGAHWIKFMRLLDEEAWLDAARLFVPDSCAERWGLCGLYHRAGRWEAHMGADRYVEAGDPALALFAAALRQRAEEVAS